MRTFLWKRIRSSSRTTQRHLWSLNALQPVTVDARQGFGEIKKFCTELDRGLNEKKHHEILLIIKKPRRFSGFDETQIVSNTLFKAFELLDPILEKNPKFKISVEYL